MLTIDGLHFRYGRGKAVLSGAALEVKDGEIGILLGRNGSGKTTLFKTILGLETPQSGTITFDGRDMLRMSRAERARCVAYVPQHIHFGALSVFDSVLMGRTAYFGLHPGREDYAAVETLLKNMGLEDYAERSAEALSGGEKQKIAIARAMAQQPRLLVFDEPTGNLDIANEQLILREAKKLAREQNIAILSSLHDLNEALSFGDRFFFMKDGVVKYAGGRECFTEEILEDIFGIRVRIVSVNGQPVILGGDHHAIS